MTRGSVTVIADDLTGAQDAAVQFRPSGGAVTLLAPEHWGEFASYPVVAVTTESRALSAGEAARRVRLVARHLKDTYGEALPRVYKKIDSLLRGRLGQEIDALLEELGLAYAVVAPAYPAQGRITAGGLHLVGGIPVAESDAGRDPLTPVTESHLVRLLSGQSRHRVGHLPLDVVMAGASAIRRHLRGLSEDGVRVVAADATTETHLEALSAVVASEAGALPCGSAGLAGPLARVLSPGGPAQERREPPKHEAPGHADNGPDRRGTLIICGTQSRAGLGQVAEVQARGAAEVKPLAPDRLAAPGEWLKVVEECARAAGDSLREGKNVLIYVLERAWESPPVPAESARAVSAAILSALGELGRRLAGEAGRLILTGGDTAMSVCAALGVRALAVEGELLPGVVAGRMLGAGGVSGVPGVQVITKAGSFGDPATLARLLAAPLS